MFSKIDFYEAQNEERYRGYALRFPDMPPDEVVWRVNNFLDLEKYSHDVIVDDGDDIYTMVNKFFKLPEDFVPSDIVDLDGVPMKRVAAEAYVKMRDSAKEEGFFLKLGTAYRSIDTQRALYEKHLNNEGEEEADKFCARACYSEHHTGYALDVGGSVGSVGAIANSPEGPWLFDNCNRFGFIIRYLPETTEITGYASEPWHLRYIGVEASQDMKKKGIKSFEEYRERFLKNK